MQPRYATANKPQLFPRYTKKLYHAIFTGRYVHRYLHPLRILFGASQGQKHRAGDKYGGKGADYHADEHGQGKIVNGAPAQYEQAEHGHQGGQRGHDGAPQGLVEAGVYDVGQRAQFMSVCFAFL